MRKNEVLSPSSNFSKGLNEDLSSLPTASVASPKANPDQQLKTLDYKPRKSGGGSLIREGHLNGPESLEGAMSAAEKITPRIKSLNKAQITRKLLKVRNNTFIEPEKLNPAGSVLESET